MKDPLVRLRQAAGASDLLEIQEELLVLQAGHSIRLQREAGVLSEDFMLEGAPVPSHTVASQVAVAMGAAQAAAENQA
jgi:hypothetical protein